MTITQEITLDTVYENAYKVIHAKQFDQNSRLLEVTVTQKGEPMEIPSGSTVIICAKRADSQVANFEGSVNTAHGTVIVPLANWMLQCSGICSCCISIIDISNSAKLSTLNFTLHVEFAPTYSSDISEDGEYDILVSVLTELEKAIKITPQSFSESQKTQARTNIGLGNVNNTSDANKPVSTPMQEALDEKVFVSDIDEDFFDALY